MIICPSFWNRFWERGVSRGRTLSISAKARRRVAGAHHPKITHGSTSTGIPTHTSFDRYSASQFASRKQPCDSVRPTCSGLGVP